MRYHVVISGGCGFIGSKLVLHLLSQGRMVTVIDKMFFGNYLPVNKNLSIVDSDIRDIPYLEGDCIVHLANIPNDPTAELDPADAWDINVIGTKHIVDLAIKAKMKRFIYLSSGSVYGISDRQNVTECTPLIPISIYNKTKMIAEEVLINRKRIMPIVILRPATVCGYSPRMRLDLTVNMLTFQALSTGKITVFGGGQIRPNIAIYDIVSVITRFIDSNKEGIYNVGFENLSILEIAEKIKSKLPETEIEVIPDKTDPRSYRLDSTKLMQTGFIPICSVDLMIDELIDCYRDGILIDTPQWHSIDILKEKICQIKL